MIIFCKITQKLIRLKFIVELLVFWQQGILLSVTEIFFFFFSPVSWVFVSGTQTPRAFVL